MEKWWSCPEHFKNLRTVGQAAVLVFRESEMFQEWQDGGKKKKPWIRHEIKLKDVSINYPVLSKSSVNRTSGVAVTADRSDFVWLQKMFNPSASINAKNWFFFLILWETLPASSQTGDMSKWKVSWVTVSTCIVRRCQTSAFPWSL